MRTTFLLRLLLTITTIAILAWLSLELMPSGGALPGAATQMMK